MNSIAEFPTKLHNDTAEIVRDYFFTNPKVDTVLVVNSCARGHAVAESDLDMAILMKQGITSDEIKYIEKGWQSYREANPIISKFKKSSRFAHLHLDIIDGNYAPTIWEVAVVSDCFELELGNQICYSSPMEKMGSYFKELQEKWLPYYDENLRLQRLTMIKNACEYDLVHIPLFIRRGLYFQAFDILCKAFQEYLQVLFIANKTYPIAYNKWIKYQVVNLLNKPDLYPQLSPVLSVSHIESNEINDKVIMLRRLLNNFSK